MPTGSMYMSAYLERVAFGIYLVHDLTVVGSALDSKANICTNSSIFYRRYSLVSYLAL